MYDGDVPYGMHVDVKTVSGTLSSINYFIVVVHTINPSLCGLPSCAAAPNVDSLERLQNLSVAHHSRRHTYRLLYDKYKKVKKFKFKTRTLECRSLSICFWPSCSHFTDADGYRARRLIGLSERLAYSLM